MRASVFSIVPIGSPAATLPTKGAKTTECGGIQSWFSRIPRARPGKSLMYPFCAMRRKCWRAELMLRNLKWREISSNVGAESASATNVLTKSKTCCCRGVSSLQRGIAELSYCSFVQYARTRRLGADVPCGERTGRGSKTTGAMWSLGAARFRRKGGIEGPTRPCSGAGGDSLGWFSGRVAREMRIPRGGHHAAVSELPLMIGRALRSASAGEAELCSKSCRRTSSSPAPLAKDLARRVQRAQAGGGHAAGNTQRLSGRRGARSQDLFCRGLRRHRRCAGSRVAQA